MLQRKLDKFKKGRIETSRQQKKLYVVWFTWVRPPLVKESVIKLGYDIEGTCVLTPGNISFNAFTILENLSLLYRWRRSFISCRHTQKCKLLQYRSKVSWQSLETRNSILDPRFSKTSRIEARVEFRDVRGHSRIYRDCSRIYRVEFRDFRAINFWHVKL